MQGKWEGADQILKQSPDWIRKPITKHGETILHIAAAAKHTHFVKELVKLMTKEDLARTNINKNTAFCLAAISGVREIAEAMVEKNKDLPNIKGNQGMTPLQMAVMLGHRDMTLYLLPITDDKKLTNEDLVAVVNSSIEADLFDVASRILSNHQDLAVHRDAKHETPLHVLARKPLNPAGGYHQQSMWKKLITLGTDIAQGTTSISKPIQLKLVERLWDRVIKEDESKIWQLIGWPWRLLFVAVKCGNVEFLKTLIHSYPNLIWKVDKEHRSIFHVAIVNRQEEVFNLIHELGAIKDLIAINIDTHGNNMLHLAGYLAPSHRLNCVSGAALQMQRELLWFKAVEKIVYGEIENKEGLTPRALFTKEHEDLRTNGEQWMKTTAESCNLVAALIATVIFAAAFTLPGGIDNRGNPMFVKRPLFMIFTISNAISLFSSSASILIFLSILTSRYAVQDFLKSLPLKLMIGLSLLFVSIATMMVAFTATFFITFREGVQWVPIPIALFAFVPVLLFVLEQRPLLWDIYISTYGSQFLFEPKKPTLFYNY